MSTVTGMPADPGPPTPAGPRTTAGAASGPVSGAVSGAVTSDDTTWDRVRRWRPRRRGVLLGLLLLLALVVLVLTSPRGTGYLDPGAVEPDGSRALARVLDDLGVQVIDARTTADAAAGATGATVLITDSTLPTDAMLDDILRAGPRRIVLVDPLPESAAFESLGSGATSVLPEGDEPVAPRCTLPEALRAGPATLPGARYREPGLATGARIPGVAACYDSNGSAAVVAIPASAEAPEVVLLGSAHPLTNAGLDEQGNASLALGLLGSRDQLVWWRPTSADPALASVAGTSLIDLLPPWVLPVLIQVVIAWLVTILWRARRLGRLVVEPLPVVIRAGETTAGHGRLLAAQHARGEAAVHLRAQALEQVRVRLGLPPGGPPERLVAVAATRSGRPPEAVHDLLYGRQPSTDTQLVALAHDLAELTTEVGGA